jgi:hypothetical protein
VLPITFSETTANPNQQNESPAQRTKDLYDRGFVVREHPEFCQELLGILGSKLAKTDQVKKALLRKEKLPRLESGVA